MRQLETTKVHYTFVPNEPQTQFRGSEKLVWYFFMDNIVVTTPEQLHSIVAQAVEAIIPKLAEHQKRANESKPKENLTLMEAVEYLAELGAPTTKSSLYNFTFQGKIPHRKIGTRNIYSRTELREWVESRTAHPDESKVEAIEHIAKCANRKLNKR